MGRPIRVRRNYWCPEMYNILEAASRRVWVPGFETEELIAEGWLRSARYGGPLNKLYLWAMTAMEVYIRRELQIQGREFYMRRLLSKQCRHLC